jgi:two-component system NtrC family sensor kinase
VHAPRAWDIVGREQAGKNIVSDHYTPGRRAGAASAVDSSAEAERDLSPEQAATPAAQRILVVDDNPAIHEDFRKILDADLAPRLDALANILFGDTPPMSHGQAFLLDSATQGEEALVMVQKAVVEQRPYAVAFVDIRMPPGWDGLETLARIWEVDPRIEAVLCSAYADYSWEQILARVGDSDQLLILKKPFDVPEVRQLVHALTAKWQLARENERRLAELEARVSERTRELASANEQLRREITEREQTERALRKAQRLEALGRLAAGIGHEINNPLTFMSAGIEALASDLRLLMPHLPPPVQTELRDLSEAAAIGADRISQIVRSIQLFGNKEERDLEVVDMGSVLSLSLRMIASELDPGIEVRTDFDEVPPILGRRVALEQVFVNLLQNAAHAVAESALAGRADRTRRITVTCRHGDQRSVIIEIADTGVGIAQEHLDRIFDPFFTTKPVNQGTGLGLSICHSIIGDHGGDIDVHSTPGKGTTVTVRLPVVRLGSPELAAMLPRPEQEAEVEAEPLRGRVLVVDDEPLILRMMMHALRDHDVVGVTSAVDGLEQCTTRKFDVILCDLMMPGMTGMQLYERLRVTNPGIEDRMVFMTGGTLLPDVQGFLASTPSPCLEKPIPIKRLRAYVDERVRRARAQRRPDTAGR